MAFLTKLVAIFAAPILEFIYGKISAAFEKWRAYQKAKEDAAIRNQQVLDQTMAAQTEKERDEAAQNAINKF